MKADRMAQQQGRPGRQHEDGDRPRADRQRSRRSASTASIDPFHSECSGSQTTLPGDRIAAGRLDQAVDGAGVEMAVERVVHLQSLRYLRNTLNHFPQPSGKRFANHLNNPSMQRVFEALSSQIRRKILAYLAHADLTAGEIAARFDISKPAVSQHLTVLENAGLVTSEKKGQFVHYSLVPDHLANTLALLCPGGLSRVEAAQGRERGHRGEEADRRLGSPLRARRRVGRTIVALATIRRARRGVGRRAQNLFYGVTPSWSLTRPVLPVRLREQGGEL
jgi:ArsR family transcriptional regulator